ncbi:Metacaspase-1 [Seminavis robusta]|uniref:Metacaspase-1 n=1 Tax=Seminavis robusta TaxID=568900 RepID=A0A9N8DIT6_9STRA|nr:Metacaspase-1 [Seminavis robusta]|eukprot:Sro144_g066840.1 Metacaspase-1 (683) ;mRNA; f:5663-7711
MANNNSEFKVPSLFAGPTTTTTNNQTNRTAYPPTTSATAATYTPSTTASGYTPSAAARGYNPSAAANGHTPSAAAVGYPSGGSSSKYTPSQAASGGYNAAGSKSTYVPSAAAMSYTPSAAATNYSSAGAGTGQNGARNTTTGTTTGYVPSAAAMGYTPSTAANGAGKSGGTSNTGGYVPSAAAMSYTPSAAATSYTPSASSAGQNGAGGYVPSASAMTYTPSTAAMSYTPSAAASASGQNGGYVPSATAMSYTPSAAATTYTPSATAMSYTPSAPAKTYTPSATASSYTPSTAAMASVPSIFSAPPPAPPSNPPKPNHSVTQSAPYAQLPPPQQQQPQYQQPPQQSHAPPQHQPQQQQQHRPEGVMNEQQRLEFEANQPEALKHADIWMISGCEDRQTSADISNVNSFQLPDPHGRAGGACTAALLNVLYENDNQNRQYSFMDVMKKMRSMIKSKKLTQIPQLSSTHPIDMNRKFEMVPEGLTGTRRAVIIGINYTGQQGALRGCHNDAFNMKKYIQQRHGFQEQHMTLLIDDGNHSKPTKANILAAYKQVVAESRPGDAIFLHYSGHGTKVKDLNGDEADGYDEALVPLDFKKAGQIIDDDLYTIIVGGLPRGVHVVSVMDCCHSGTILDLPYIFKANGEFSQMEIDEGYNEKKGFSFFGGDTGKMLGAAVVGGILGGLLF